MTRKVPPTTSARHGFTFSAIPTVGGSAYGGSYPNGCGATQPSVDYGQVLDCVFEMAGDLADCNGLSHDRAVDQVLRDEGWRILPTHRAEIIRRLDQVGLGGAAQDQAS